MYVCLYCHKNVYIVAPPLSRRVRIKTYLLNYNLFETLNSTALTRPKELLSTRCYVTLSIILAIIILLYARLSNRIKNEKVTISFQSSYEQLQRLYSDTLQCPCLNPSMSYATFILHLNTTIHPVCSSFLISDSWKEDFDHLTAYQEYRFNSKDFRLRGIQFFQFLTSLCLKANSTIISAIDQFRLNSFMSTEVISPIQFQSQIGQALEVFQHSIETQFSRPLQLFRASAQGNGLISLSGTNVLLSYVNDRTNSSLIYTPKLYNNATCSCATSSSCFEPAFISNRNRSIVYRLENILVGCFGLDSILRSSLSCFFSNSCFIDFKRACLIGLESTSGTYFGRSNGSLSILTLAENSRYEMDDTIETIVNTLFIDFWSSEISYEQYYNACASAYCTYTHEERYDVLSSLTMFVSLFYGVSAILRFIVPYTVKLILRVWIFISN